MSSSEYRPLDDGGFVPQRPKGKTPSFSSSSFLLLLLLFSSFCYEIPFVLFLLSQTEHTGDDLLAESEAVGYRESKRSTAAAGERQTNCCCSQGVLAVIAYWTLFIGGL